MDDKSKTGGQDCKRISTSEDYEVLDWAKTLGFSKEQLLDAVKAVGNDAEAVCQHLAGKGGCAA